MTIAVRSHESSTHLWGSQETVSTMLMCSPVPASAPVCVTEYLPLIAEGLALHPLFLLPSQPSMCTLLHKFNLNQMEKKGCIKKPQNGIWIFQVQQRMQRIIEQSGAKGRWTSALFISQVQ